MTKTDVKLLDVTFHIRACDDLIGSPNPFRWEEKTTADHFSKKHVIPFSLLGAFTPTCSIYQFRGFEIGFTDLAAKCINAIYCVSINDRFVMYK